MELICQWKPFKASKIDVNGLSKPFLSVIKEFSGLEKNSRQHLLCSGLVILRITLGLEIFECWFWNSLKNLTTFTHKCVWELLPFDDTNYVFACLLLFFCFLKVLFIFHIYTPVFKTVSTRAYSPLACLTLTLSSENVFNFLLSLNTPLCFLF